MFGKCKVCLEKDQRIADLKARVAFLEGYISPVKHVEPLIEHLSTQAGTQPVIDITDIEPIQNPNSERDAAEALEILSGSY